MADGRSGRVKEPNNQQVTIVMSKEFKTKLLGSVPDGKTLSEFVRDILKENLGL